MNKNSYLFELAHPKHYHMFKVIIDYLEKKDKKITIVARDKDVLLSLLESDGRDYIILGPHKDGLIKKLLITPLLLLNYLKILIRKNPKFILSKASPYASFYSILSGIKHIIFPDSDGFKSNDFLMNFCEIIVTPENYRNNYGHKHKKVSGFFENMYLHPDQFTPDKQILEKYSINPKAKYSIVRFVGWGAHHDSQHKGFGIYEKRDMIETLGNYGPVFITSEKPLEKGLEKYRLKINPVDIHHILFYSSLYIGDSQSMATEASLLGVPSIRVNSFVGDNDMSNFKLLEERYNLLFNFSDPGKAIKKAEVILSDELSKEIWRKRRNTYYANNRNVTRQIIKIIEKLS